MQHEQLEQTLSDKVAELGYEWVGCEWVSAGSSRTLRIYVDCSGGINIDQCAEVSRELATLIDVLDAVQTRFQLEVSSPGINRLLFTLPHYEQSVGHQVNLLLRFPDESGRRRFKASLLAVEGTVIVLQLDDTSQVRMEYADIEKANRVVDLERGQSA